jgi:threonine dehydrogenase-like Zn-dependent dehydrogenase
MKRWHLYGAGLENLGRDSAPEEVDVPTCGPDQLLVRVDAIGLCFSDTKVIAQGPNHPRMNGRDLRTDPATLGHEVACTVVEVGEELTGKFRVGQRFTVQADVFYQGRSMAYGYAISGGLAQYSIIPKEMIEGDEGCYLLPLADETGYAEAALVEPWACVVSAYNQTHRAGLKPGGAVFVLAGDDASGVKWDWSGLLGPDTLPAVAVFAPVLGGLYPASLVAPFAAAGVECRMSKSGDEPDLLKELHAKAGFDDILVFGSPKAEDIESAASMLANHGIMNVVGSGPFPRALSLDIGRVHYNWWHFIGTASTAPAAAYTEGRTADLRTGGTAWMIGAGGPMGQMHVQRAVMHKNPPRRVVATDVDVVRLQSVVDRFADRAAARGVELIALNPKEFGEEAFDAELRRLSEGRGFDDIVCMVPSSALIEHATGFLANEGWLNIFAGVARGTMASLDMNRIVRDGCRFLGSSGSSLADMRNTLERVETGELATNASAAAIGGMEAASEGLRAVKEQVFPGKTLIYPHISGLPLTQLSELKDRLPGVYAKLQDGKFWTKEAEEELLVSGWWLVAGG